METLRLSFRTNKSMESIRKLALLFIVASYISFVTLSNRNKVEVLFPSLKKTNAVSKIERTLMEGEEHHLFLNNLREEFDSWMQAHGRKYDSDHEKENRFQIWKENHLL